MAVLQAGVPASPTRTIASEATLQQNYPKPVHISAGGSTTIRFDLMRRTAVRITIHDLLGREVAIVAEGKFDDGVHHAKWAPGDMPAGIYLYRLQAGGQHASKKLTITR